MRYSLKRIHYGRSKIIGGPYPVFLPLPIVSALNYAKKRWVAQHGVLRVHVAPKAHYCPACSNVAPHHFFPQEQIFLPIAHAAVALMHSHAVFLYLLRVARAHVCAVFHHELLRICIELLHPVRSVSFLLPAYPKPQEPVFYCLHKLHFLFFRVCVIKAQQHLPAVFLHRHILKERSLCMPYVRVSRRLRRKPCNNFPRQRSLKLNFPLFLLFLLKRISPKLPLHLLNWKRIHPFCLLIYFRHGAFHVLFCRWHLAYHFPYYFCGYCKLVIRSVLERPFAYRIGEFHNTAPISHAQFIYFSRFSSKPAILSKSSVE